jgi:hypothetical protein
MVNQVISAYRYNVLFEAIENILGIPSGDSGYNQSVESERLPRTRIVYAEDMNKLYNDYVAVYAHQNGTLPATISTVTSENEITESLYTAYETLYPLLFANRHDVDASQISQESAGIDSLRTSNWGGTGTPQSITHEWKATFSNNNNLLGFFNAGGNIEMSFEMTSAGSDDKSQGWADMLGNIGNVTIDFTGTQVSGSGSPQSNIGIYDLTTTYVKIFEKLGSGIYTNNDLEIYARRDETQIFIKTVLADESVGTDPGGAGPIDETVSGRITSFVKQNRPTGSYVELPTPSYQNLQTFQ